MHATLLLGLAILMASVAAAAAGKIDRKCYRHARANGFTVAAAKLACRPDVGPCEGDGTESARVKATAKRGLCVNE